MIVDTTITLTQLLDKTQFVKDKRALTTYVSSTHRSRIIEIRINVWLRVCGAFDTFLQRELHRHCVKQYTEVTTLLESSHAANSSPGKPYGPLKSYPWWWTLRWTYNKNTCLW